MTDALAALRDVLSGRPAWLVGGAVRDRLIGRPVGDLDVVVRGDVAVAAKSLSSAVRGPAFELSSDFGAWRVIGPGRRWQVDLTAVHGDSIEEDLARRDFTVNAMAEPLDDGPLVDPHGGRADLEARRLRMVAERAFDDDPLRTLRLARFACELALEPEPATLSAARARAPRIDGTAPERVFAELRRIVVADRALDGLALMDGVGLTARVLPELDALRGVEQNTYHHRDVHGHTLEVLQRTIELERDPATVLGDAELGREVAAVLAEPLADDLTRAGALRLGALLHDIAKPATQSAGPRGYGFPGHADLGAEMTRAVLARLRASERLRAHVAALARHHLRAGYLVHEAPLSRRAIHRYLVTCDPVQVDVTLLSIADRLATRGRKAGEAIARHLDVGRTLLRAALQQRSQAAQAPLVRGDELAAALGIRPGPALGRLLAEIAEARYAGEVRTREDAIELARHLSAGGPG